MKLNKDTFEVEFVDTLTCFCGGGSDDDDGGSNDNNNSGGGDPSFYDNERPGIPDGNRPVGGTTNVFEGSSQPSNNDDNDSSPPPLPPQPADPNFYSDLAAAAAEAAAALPAAPPPVDLGIATGTSQPVDISVGSTNLPPPVITGVDGVPFDTTTGNVISGDASYFGDIPTVDDTPGGMVPLNSAPVPVPPPPRYQTNAQKDFYENLAAQGDAAMNQFRAEVRNLNNRGFLGSQIAAGIGADGVPNFDPTFPAGSQIRGVTTTNFVDLPVIGTVPVSTYTGLDNPNAPSDVTDDNDVVPPVANPMTGTSQCPDGYTFDEDLQACRRMTKRELRGDADSSTASGDMFYRRTSLDDAPANLPGGFNFADANRRFTQSYAFRPSFYRNPMDTTGFTKLL